MKREKNMATEGPGSTELLLILWLKEVISLTLMELEENQSTEKNSQMRTLN